MIWLGGPIDWMSKRQTYTARSSAQAEIGAVDECAKSIQHIINILKDLSLFNNYHTGPITIYNDNLACVQWSHNMTTKGLRYIQICENAVRELVQARTSIQVKHVAGKNNCSDIFTKEDRDITHFQQCRDSLCSAPPVNPTSPANQNSPLLELCSKGGSVLCQAVHLSPTITMES